MAIRILILCGLVVSLAAASLTVLAEEHLARLFSQPESKLTIEGTSDLHSWTVEAEEVSASADLPGAFLTTASQRIEIGRVQGRVEGYIPIRSLHSSTDPWADKIIYRELKEEADGRIRFRFTELTLKALPKVQNEPYLFDSLCELIVAGVTNRISIPLQMLFLGSSKVKITGETFLSISTFGVQLKFIESTSHKAFGPHDRVKVNFEWILAEKLNK